MTEAQFKKSEKLIQRIKNLEESKKTLKKLFKQSITMSANMVYHFDAINEGGKTQSIVWNLDHLPVDKQDQKYLLACITVQIYELKKQFSEIVSSKK